jgi:hypothetical protein
MNYIDPPNIAIACFVLAGVILLLSQVAGWGH